MCIQLPASHTGKERVEGVEKGGDKDGPSLWPPQELSDTLRHVQRGQHLFKDGSLHVGPSQVGFLQVAAGQVTVLQDR